MASLYAKYNRLLVSRPILTNVLSTAFLFGSGDFLAQIIRGEEYDVARTIRALAYGGVLFAPIGVRWYGFLSKIRGPGLNIGKFGKDFRNTATRVAVDQLGFAPFVGVPLYFVAISLMEGKSTNQIQEGLREKWWPTVKANWVVWPAVQVVNFAFIPAHLRLFVVSLAGLGWNCFILIQQHRQVGTQE